LALVEVAIVSPGAISADVSVLDADDQLLLQLVPLNSDANGPVRKFCIAAGVIDDTSGLVVAKPKVVWNAWSTAV
jgi:hypothetical protein